MSGSFARVGNAIAITKRMRIAFLLVAAEIAGVLTAQTFSLGAAGGGGLTDAFQTETFPVPFGVVEPIGIRYYSQSRDYIVGLTLELGLSPSWSVEADALYRELHLASATLLSDGSLNTVSPAPVVTWEFPILAKYRFGEHRTKPFFEAGPSFRTAGNLNGTNPTHVGVTAGAGMQIAAGRFVIAPVARYTRWAEETLLFDHARTNPNQLELLVDFSATFHSAKFHR